MNKDTTGTTLEQLARELLADNGGRIDHWMTSTDSALRAIEAALRLAGQGLDKG